LSDWVGGAISGYSETAEQDRQQNECQRGRGCETANDNGSERFLNFGARAIGKQQRDEPERRDAGGHQHRPKPPKRSFKHGLGNACACG
jgi:hypothetical protein